MKYIIWETDCGELFNIVGCFKNILDAEKFIMSCGFATDITQNLNDPVIEIVSDDFKIPQYVYKETEKRFRRCTIY